MYNVVQDWNEDAIQRTSSPFNWEAHGEYMESWLDQDYENLSEIKTYDPVGTKPCENCGIEMVIHAPETMIPNFSRCKDCTQEDIIAMCKEQGLTTLWGISKIPLD